MIVKIHCSNFHKYVRIFIDFYTMQNNKKNLYWSSKTQIAKEAWKFHIADG